MSYNFIESIHELVGLKWVFVSESVEGQVKWLKNFERLQELSKQIQWFSVLEQEPRPHLPEVSWVQLSTVDPFLRSTSRDIKELIIQTSKKKFEIRKKIINYMHSNPSATAAILIEIIEFLNKLSAPTDLQISADDIP